MTRNALPSADYLRATFRYDPETGLLYWRNRADVPPKWNGRYAGKVAGNVQRGAVCLILSGGHLKAHRVVWKMVYGEDPPHEIDHADGDGTNNRLSNLRAATHRQNMINIRGWASSGHKGVSLHKRSGLWRARVKADGKEICRYCKTPDEAAAVYAALAAEHYGEFARVA